jgi:hypothetical protein
VQPPSSTVASVHFWSRSHLPATLLASFVKKLSRLSLNAPPAGIITIVPFTYNILKRHPALMVMIHRLDDSDSEGTDGTIRINQFLGQPWLKLCILSQIPTLLVNLTRISRTHWSHLCGSLYHTSTIIILRCLHSLVSSKKRLPSQVMRWRISWTTLTARYMFCGVVHVLKLETDN